jgi:hypothetical protein
MQTSNLPLMNNKAQKTRNSDHFTNIESIPAWSAC